MRDHIVHINSVRSMLAMALFAYLAACNFEDMGADLIRIGIEPSEARLAVEEHRELYLMLHYDDGYSEPAPEEEVLWRSDNGSILEVRDSGQVRGRGRGGARVNASFRGQDVELDLDVYDIPRQLEMRTERQDIATGLTRAFSVELRYQHGDRADVTDKVMWTTTRSDIARVDTLGVATGIAPGRVNVVADGFGLRAQRELHVTPAIAIDITLLPAEAVLQVGQTLQLSASAVFSDGNVVNITNGAQWSSSLSSVAYLSRNGTVVARAPGQVTITAGQHQVFAAAQITVTARSPRPALSSRSQE